MYVGIVRNPFQFQVQELLRQVATLSRYIDSSDGESEVESRRHVHPLAYVCVSLTYRILALQSTVSHLTFHKHLMEGDEALLQSFPTRRQTLERVVFDSHFLWNFRYLCNGLLGYVFLHANLIGPATAEVITIIDSAAEEKIGGSAHLSDHSVVAQESK